MVETNFSLGLSMSGDVDPTPEIVDLVEDARFEALRHLQPGLYAVHRELLSSMTDDASRRIVAGPLPFVIGIRSDIHCLDLQLAVRATIEWIGAEAAGRISPSVEIILETDDISSERQCIKTGLLSGRVVVLIRSGKGPSAHDALLDVRIDLPEIGLHAIRDSLEREYGPDAALPPLDVRPEAFTYDLLDLACTKASCAADAWNIVRSLGAKTPPKVSKAVRVPSLDALVGYGDAMTWARDLRDDIAAYRDGTLPWSDVSASALLVGPPGTGKTTFAAAVAGDLGLAFHPTSYAAWQRAGDGHMGDVMAEMARVFERATAARPSLVFIDEIDSLPRRTSVGRSADWWRSVVNAVLEFIDGTAGREGVVVLAACNDDAGLDDALVRAGRLDRRLEIGLPSPVDFASILSGHLDGDVSAAALAGVASSAAGTLSGADAARIARDARRMARRARRAVTITDVEAAAFPAEERPASALWRIAVHEAGHALVALASGVFPVRATLLTAPRSGGSVYIDETGRDATLDSDLANDARIALGGRAGEVVLLGAPSTGSGGSASSDLALATRIVRAGLTIYGFGPSLEHSGHADPADVDARLQRLYSDAIEIVSSYRTETETLARLLVERRTLTQSDLRRFAETHDIRV